MLKTAEAEAKSSPFKTRPLMTVGAIYLMTAFLLSFFVSVSFSALTAIIASVTALISLSELKLRKETAYKILVVSAAVLLASLSFFGYILRTDFDKSQYYDNSYDFQGVVKEIDYTRNGNYRLTVRITDRPFGNAKKNINAYLYVRGDNIPDFYDKIRFNATVSRPTPLPDFDLEQYNEQNKISLSLFLNDEIEITKESNGLFRKIKSFREQLYERIVSLYSFENSQIISSILLGKDNLPYDIEIYSRIIGVSHIFVLSGLHIGLLSAATFFFCSNILKLNRRKSAVLSALLIWSFVFMTGFRASAVRAGIMFTMFLSAGLFNRKNDSLTSLILAGVVIAIINPLAVSAPSFLLSFSATLGVIELTEPINGFLFGKVNSESKLLKNVCGVISMSISSNIAILPFLLYFFRGFSLCGIILNIIIIPLSELLMIVSAVSLLPCFGFLSGLGNFICDLLSEIIRFSGRLNFGYIGMNYKPILIATPFILALVLSAVISKKKDFSPAILIITVILLSFSFGICFWQEQGKTVSEELQSYNCNAEVTLSNSTAIVEFLPPENGETDGYIISDVTDFLLSKNARQVVITDGGGLMKFKEYRLMKEIFEVVEINPDGVRIDGEEINSPYPTISHKQKAHRKDVLFNLILFSAVPLARKHNFRQNRFKLLIQ